MPCSAVFSILFEDIPASDRKPDDVYLDEVDRCRVYVGLFGNEYVTPVANGKSATELEFDRATAKKKTRLIFVKGSDDTSRRPRMLALIRKIGSQLVRRRFSGIPDLTAALYAALVEHLERTGHLRTLPFDASACDRAAMDDLSQEKLRWFLETARHERNYALSGKIPGEKMLKHLNLLDRDRPNHAAVLLFGKEPQRFLITSEVKCLHFHETEVRKPIPSYQIFKGTVFD